MLSARFRRVKNVAALAGTHGAQHWGCAAVQWDSPTPSQLLWHCQQAEAASPVVAGCIAWNAGQFQFRPDAIEQFPVPQCQLPPPLPLSPAGAHRPQGSRVRAEFPVHSGAAAHGDRDGAPHPRLRAGLPNSQAQVSTPPQHSASTLTRLRENFCYIAWMEPVLTWRGKCSPCPCSTKKGHPEDGHKIFARRMLMAIRGDPVIWCLSWPHR